MRNHFLRATGGGGTPWTPASITTALWLDAADTATITSSANIVTQWNDKSGNNRHFAQSAVPAARPSTGIDTRNGKNVLTFAGSFLRTVNSDATWNFMSNGTPYSTFTVVEVAGQVGAGPVYGLMGSDGTAPGGPGGFSQLYWFNARNLGLRCGGRTQTQSGPVFKIGELQLVSVAADWANATFADRAAIRVNGGTPLLPSPGEAGTLGAATRPMEIGSVGNDPVTGYRLHGKVAEVIVVQGLVDNPTRLLIEGYLMTKWGITAPTPPGGLWTPAELNTALWLDAADTSTITNTAGAVDQWADKSGNARNFTGTTTTRPTTNANTLNSKNVLDFAGDYLTSASAASTWTFLHNTTGSSVFFVVKAGTGSNPDAAYAVLGTDGFASANRGIIIVYEDRSSIPRNNAFSSSVTRGTVGTWAVINEAVDQWTPNAYQVLGVVTDPGNATAASRQSARFNGGSSLANNANTSSASASAPTNTLQIGASGASTFALTGSLAEVVIVSGLISSTNREKMEGYLAWKWGLQANLPGGHPYKTNPPTVV